MLGQTIGAYRIESELGRGGMGRVYLAISGDRRFALKVFHSHLLCEPDSLARFMREAEIGKAIRQKNVVRCVDAGAFATDDDVLNYLVMEYVEGQTLRGLSEELEVVPEELCRHIGREVSQGLAAIHAAGAVHRDLKPENILITPDHEIKIMDLGVAHLMDEAIRLSRTGSFVGSPLYASPEQFTGSPGEIDGRADLFSLGVILYELSCGAHPHPASGFMQVLANVLEKKPRPLGERNPQLSPFFEEVVHTLLEKDKEERLPTASKLLQVLTQGEQNTWWGRRARAIRAETSRPLRRIRIPRETSLYGRDAELSKLESLFDQVRSGEGQVVLVSGEAGIGKSRLIDEFVGGLRQEGHDLNFLFGSYPPGATAAGAGAFSEAYREHFGEDGAAPWLSQTPMLAPSFDALLRGEPAGADAEPLTQESIGTCFVHTTRNLAAERPTIVLIDDLHFAPEEARSLFITLAMAVPDHPILLIASQRPGADEQWRSGLARLERVSQLSLNRLGAKDLVSLLRDAFHSERLATELAGQIALKSDGNPFFVFEIIEGLREGRFISRRPDGKWITTKVVHDIEIPSSVMDLIKARLSDLSAEELELLDVASCCGFEFNPVLVGAVLGLRRIPALRAFARIERAHRLVRSKGRVFAFDHHQVREAIYEALPDELREAYHAEIATALEESREAADADSLDGALAFRLSDHFLKGARGESALPYLNVALTHLTESHLYAPAADLAERALAVPDLLDGPDRLDLLLRICVTNSPLDRLARRERQEEVAREAERLAEKAGDDRRLGRAVTALGVICYRTARQQESLAALERGLDLAIATDDRKGQITAMGNLATAVRAEGRFKEAEEYNARVIAVSREIDDKKSEAAATLNQGTVFSGRGRVDEARDCYEQALALSREVGFRQVEAAALGNLGNLDRARGRHADAERLTKEALALSREIGYRQGEASFAVSLGGTLQSQGRLTEAREYLRMALALSREIGNWRVEAVAQHSLAFVKREEGDWEAALEVAESSLALCEKTRFHQLAAGTRLLIGSIRVAEGGDPASRGVLEAARDQATEIGLPGVATLALCELAALPDGDAEPALASFAENIERLTTGEHIEAHLLLFKATGDQTHLTDAKQLLQESVAQVPDDIRDSMLTNLRVYREIDAANVAPGAT